MTLDNSMSTQYPQQYSIADKGDDDNDNNKTHVHNDVPDYRTNIHTGVHDNSNKSNIQPMAKYTMECSPRATKSYDKNHQQAAGQCHTMIKCRWCRTGTRGTGSL